MHFKACVSTGAAGTWHPLKFRTSPLTPADFEVLNTILTDTISLWVTLTSVPGLHTKWKMQKKMCGVVFFEKSLGLNSPPGSCVLTYLLLSVVKVSKCQNENMKWSHCPKYEQKD